MKEKTPAVLERIIDHRTMVKQAIHKITTEAKYQAELALKILGVVEFDKGSRAYRDFGVDFFLKVPGHSDNALAVPLRVVDVEDRGGRSIKKRMGKKLIAEVRISLRDSFDRVVRAVIKAIKPMLTGIHRKMKRWTRRQRPKANHREESREFINRPGLCCMAH